MMDSAAQTGHGKLTVDVGRRRGNHLAVRLNRDSRSAAGMHRLVDDLAD
jgi:hypothetical protein